jgi:hypothetical protein
MSQVLTVSREQVERDEARFNTVEQQIVELWMAAVIEADNFPVQYGTVRQAAADLLGKTSEGTERMTIAGKESASAGLDYCERTSARKPSYFSSNNQFGSSNGSALRPSGIGVTRRWSTPHSIAAYFGTVPCCSAISLRSAQ